LATTKPLRGVVMGLAVKTGASPPEIMAQLGFGFEMLQDSDARARHSFIDGVWGIAEKLSGDEGFGRASSIRMVPRGRAFRGERAGRDRPLRARSALRSSSAPGK
jgi:hypothetical protein